MIFKFCNCIFIFQSSNVFLLEIKSVVSLRNESLLFWVRVYFKGESQVLQNFEREGGVRIKGGSDRFRSFAGSLGKKGWGQYFRVEVISYDPIYIHTHTYKNGGEFKVINSNNSTCNRIYLKNKSNILHFCS